MRTRIVAALVLASGLQACSAPKSEDHNISNETAPSAPQPNSPLHSQGAKPEYDKPAAKPSTSLAEPKGPIDPKSVEAAGQVVQLFAALLESGQLDEAAKQWSDPAAGSRFLSQFKQTTHVEISELTPAEGAAGSIYTTMPATFYGENYRRRAEITLRRVNDVPGSTERQRQWHIDRIEWKTGA